MLSQGMPKVDPFLIYLHLGSYDKLLEDLCTQDMPPPISPYLD